MSVQNPDRAVTKQDLADFYTSIRPYLAGVSSTRGIAFTVNCSQAFAGTQITCTDGTTALTRNCTESSPYHADFVIPNSGTWTISGQVNSTSYSTSVVIPGSASLNANS